MPFLLSDTRLPEPVKIAPGIGKKRRVTVRKRKLRDRGHGLLYILELAALAADEAYKRDTMLPRHRVAHLSDVNGDAVSLLSYNGQMLLGTLALLFRYKLLDSTVVLYVKPLIPHSYNDVIAFFTVIKSHAELPFLRRGTLTVICILLFTRVGDLIQEI